MPIPRHKPKIDDIKQGSDARIQLGVKNVDGSVRDYAGATGTFTFVPRREGAQFVKDIVLNPNPGAIPQIFVDLVPADTEDLIPQEIDVFGEILMADGKTDRPTFWFRLLKGIPAAVP